MALGKSILSISRRRFFFNLSGIKPNTDKKCIRLPIYKREEEIGNLDDLVIDAHIAVSKYWSHLKIVRHQFINTEVSEKEFGYKDYLGMNIEIIQYLDLYYEFK